MATSGGGGKKLADHLQKRSIVVEGWGGKKLTDNLQKMPLVVEVLGWGEVGRQFTGELDRSKRRNMTKIAVFE